VVCQRLFQFPNAIAVLLFDARPLVTAMPAGNDKRLLVSVEPFAFASREPQDQAPVNGCQLFIEFRKCRILADQFFVPVMRVSAIKTLSIELFGSGEADQHSECGYGDEPRLIERGSFYLSGALD